ncbi:MAG: SdiA-regulated domain-containing protein [Saprospiraceae bacterium]
MKLFFSIPILVFFFMNCKTQLIHAQYPNALPYSINEPQGMLELPLVLKEISGLTLSPNGEHLCAINDEEGIIYFINKSTGKIDRETKFHGQGDYEGIETVGDKIFVIKSTGTVYEVSDLEKEEVKSKKSKYILKKPNDSEGLALDEKNNRLLVACKSASCFHENCVIHTCKTRRAIYSLNLETDMFDTEPTFEVDLTELQTFLKKNKSADELDIFKKFITLENDYIPFHPSALAIQPMSGDIYILSSKGKTMMILNPEGKIIAFEKLDKKIHTQPEGIVFDKDGTLYISNEGKKGGNGTISIFRKM